MSADPRHFSRILFISHSATRTGAPLVLLRLERWLREHSELRFATVLREGGPLAEEFAAVAATTLLSAASGRSLLRRVARRLNVSGLPLTQPYVGDVPRGPWQLIYSNTVTNGALVDALRTPGIPVITHVHEMDYWIGRCGAENWERVTRHTTLFVAASEAVARNLRERQGVAADRIEVVYESIPVEVPPGVEAKAQHVRSDLGITPEAFVVAGSGTEMWRKGRDLFVQVAAQMAKSPMSRPWHFLWVGQHGDEESRHWLAHDARLAGVSERVTWVGEAPNPMPYFAAADAFAMVSREDPFPLVCLEAALLGKPVCCFAEAGGIPELVEEDAGAVVPYLDVGAMAGRLLDWAQDESRRTALGKRASNKVRERFSVETAAKRIEAIIGHVMASMERIE
jgi:glycosyltransferase involved in cell wall biosynthesis